jgi:hypothetical protein
MGTSRVLNISSFEMHILEAKDSVLNAKRNLDNAVFDLAKMLFEKAQVATDPSELVPTVKKEMKSLVIMESIVQALEAGLAKLKESEGFDGDVGSTSATSPPANDDVKPEPVPPEGDSESKADKSDAAPAWKKSTVFKSPMLELDQTEATQKGVSPFLNSVAQTFCRLIGTTEKSAQLEGATGKRYILRLYEVLTGDQETVAALDKHNEKNNDSEKRIPLEALDRGIQALVDGSDLSGEGQRFLGNLAYAQLANQGTFASKSVVESLNNQRQEYGRKQKPSQTSNQSLRSLENSIEKPQKKSPGATTEPKLKLPVLNQEGTYTVTGGTRNKPNCTGLEEGSKHAKVLSGLATKLRPALFKKVNGGGLTQAQVDAQKTVTDALEPPKAFVETKLDEHLKNLQKTKESEPPLNGAKRLHQFAVLLLAACPDLGKVTLEEGKPGSARQYTVSPFLVKFYDLQGKLEYLESNKADNADKAVEDLCSEWETLIKTACNEKYTQPAAVGVEAKVEVDNVLLFEMPLEYEPLDVDVDVVVKLIRNWNSGATENNFETCRAQVYNLFCDENVLQALTGMDEKQIKRLVPNLLEAALREFDKVDNGIGSADNPLSDFFESFTSAKGPNGEQLRGDALLRHIHNQLRAYLPESDASPNIPSNDDGVSLSRAETDQLVRAGFVEIPDSPDPVVNKEDVATSSLDIIDKAIEGNKLIDLLNEHNKVSSIAVEDLILDAFNSNEPTLDLSGQGLTVLPDDLFTYLPQLEVLNLSDNQLKSLPRSLKQLKNLTSLDLRTSSGPLLQVERAEIDEFLPNMKGTVVYPNSEEVKVEFKTTDKSRDQDGNVQDPHGSPSHNTGNTKHSAVAKQVSQDTGSADSPQPTAHSQQQQPTDPVRAGLELRRPNVNGVTWNRRY